MATSAASHGNAQEVRIKVPPAQIASGMMLIKYTQQFLHALRQRFPDDANVAQVANRLDVGIAMGITNDPKVCIDVLSSLKAHLSTNTRKAIADRNTQVLVDAWKTAKPQYIGEIDFSVMLGDAVDATTKDRIWVYLAHLVSIADGKVPQPVAAQPSGTEAGTMPQPAPPVDLNAKIESFTKTMEGLAPQVLAVMSAISSNDERHPVVKLMKKFNDPDNPQAQLMKNAWQTLKAELGSGDGVDESALRGLAEDLVLLRDEIRKIRDENALRDERLAYLEGQVDFARHFESTQNRIAKAVGVTPAEKTEKTRRARA